MFWFFNQLAELNLIQIPKKPDVSSQWPLFLRLFYLKRCHTHWETSMCTPISSIWASPNFFHIYTWWSPITTLCYTVHTTTVLLSLFKMEIQEERKWKYLGKTQQMFHSQINPHHFIFLQCTLLYRVSPFHMYYCHVPQNQIVLVTIERTTVVLQK